MALNLFVSILLVGAACASAVPQVFWASSPVLPGETILLGTTSRADKVQISCNDAHWAMRSWENASALGVTENGLAVTVPADWPPSTYSVRVGLDVLGDDSDWSDPFTINAPEPWFLFGDQGSTSTPGGFVRVVGNNLNYDVTGTVATLRLVSNTSRKSLTLQAINSSIVNRWHAEFQLPSTLETGQYEAAFSNGVSSATLCTFIDENIPCLSTLTVTNPKAWPTKVFTVNAPQPGFGRNATMAIQAALDQATIAGGAIVFLPRGQYFVTGAIRLPENTVLRGAGADLVSIYFAEDSKSTAPDAYVTGVGSSFGVEQVTLYVTSYANNVVRFQPGTDGAFLRHSRIRFNSYFCLEAQEGQGSRGRNTAWSTAQGTAVKIAGRNVEIVGNDIYSTGDVVSTRDNGATGAEYLLVKENRMWNGGTTHWGISWKQAIYEGNQATGVGAAAMGSNYPQYGGPNPHVQNIYHHNNTQNLVWGNDREMMTTDCCCFGASCYFGNVKPQMPGSLSCTLTAPVHSTMPGGALCVLNGTNAGDCRRIAAGGNASVLMLDKPFIAPLDETSLVTTVPFQGHIAFVGNRYSDGGEVQLYGLALGCIMADNTFERTGGLSAWARSDGHGWGTNQRNQLLDNRIIEGNHVYNYDTKPNSAQDPTFEAYFPGGSKTIEPWSIGSLTNDQGMPVEARPPAAFRDAFNRLIVIRSNMVDSNGGIVVRGTSANVVVEGNTVKESDVGIHVNYTTTRGGIVVRGNVEPKGLPPNYNPYSSESDATFTI